jgi:hypothetical protein
MNKDTLENEIDDEIIAYQEDEEEIDEPIDEESSNIPVSGSPLYPRWTVGDSAKPLSGQFNESGYIDDNISRTWTGLLTSFYG